MKRSPTLVNVALDPEVLDEVTALARADGVTLDEYVRRVIERDLRTLPALRSRPPEGSGTAKPDSSTFP